MPKLGALKIHSIGGIHVTDAMDVLTTLEDTYNAICVFDDLLDAALYYGRIGAPRGFYLGGAGIPLLWQTRLGHISGWPPTPSTLRASLNYRNRLILKSVELHSPGFWEVLGSLNPLETIRKGLGDAHERRKDREYRETAEKRQLDLENRLRETELMQKQVELLKSLGATEADLASFRNVLVIDPILKLERLQDRGLLNGTEEVNRDIDD